VDAKTQQPHPAWERPRDERLATWAISISPDSKKLLTGHSDNTLRIWDLETGTQDKILSGHTGRITDVATSPDGQLLATCALDRTIRVWDPAQTTLRRTLKGHQYAVHRIAFFPDSTALVSVGGNEVQSGTAEVKIWDLPRDDGPTRILSRASDAGAEPQTFPATPLSDWKWADPVNLGERINSLGNDSAPTLTDDELTLCFHSNRSGGLGGRDLWLATRAAHDAPFSSPRNLGPMVNTDASESDPALSADGLTLVFGRNSPSGNGESDLWVSSRPSVTEGFGPAENLGPPVNSEFAENAPWLSADELTLVFQSNRPDSHRWYNIWAARRETPSDPFEQPVSWGVATDLANEYGPALSADQRILVFHSSPPGYELPGLFGCQRDEKNAPFGKPIRLAVPGQDRWKTITAELSASGNTLYFASDRPGGQGNTDIWYSRRVK
jgi:WD40 repeat protein